MSDFLVDLLVESAVGLALLQLNILVDSDSLEPIALAELPLNPFDFLRFLVILISEHHVFAQGLEAFVLVLELGVEVLIIFVTHALQQHLAVVSVLVEVLLEEGLVVHLLEHTQNFLGVVHVKPLLVNWRSGRLWPLPIKLGPLLALQDILPGGFVPFQLEQILGNPHGRMGFFYHLVHFIFLQVLSQKLRVLPEKKDAGRIFRLPVVQQP